MRSQVREQDVEGVDANMRAIDERGCEAPGRSDRQRVARQLVGTADRAGEELAHQHVDADQQRGEQHQGAPEPQAPLGQSPHAGKRASHMRFPDPCGWLRHVSADVSAWRHDWSHH